MVRIAIAPETIHLSTTARTNQWSESLSFASAESDFVSAPETVHLSTTTARNNLWSESLSFASAESDFVAAPETLHVATSARDTVLERHSLIETPPKTMTDALNDERPIVVTTVDSPFRVVDVNGAWEGLLWISESFARPRHQHGISK